MKILSKKRTNSVDSCTPMAASRFSNIILDYLDTYYTELFSDLLIVCIGTDRSTGDCLGPLTGYKLSNSLKRYVNVHVIGTLDEPVHAKNLIDKIEGIKTKYNNPFIIAVDASLGDMDRIGHISVSLGPLKPGAGVNKDLPHIGDAHITGVVNLSGFMEYVVLQNTRLSVVMKMAEVISSSFISAIWRFSNNKNKHIIKN